MKYVLLIRDNPDDVFEGRWQDGVFETKEEAEDRGLELYRRYGKGWSVEGVADDYQPD